MSTVTAVRILAYDPLIRAALRMIAAVAAFFLVLPHLAASAQTTSIPLVTEAAKAAGDLSSQALLALTTIAAVGGLVWQTKAANAAQIKTATEIATIRQILQDHGFDVTGPRKE